jgi:hypothetical protein
MLNDDPAFGIHLQLTHKYIVSALFFSWPDLYGNNFGLWAGSIYSLTPIISPVFRPIARAGIAEKSTLHSTEKPMR